MYIIVAHGRTQRAVAQIDGLVKIHGLWLDTGAAYTQHARSSTGCVCRQPQQLCLCSFGVLVFFAPSNPPRGGAGRGGRGIM
jgi:hypothetical protein